MSQRSNWLRFHLERLLLRGAHYRLLLMAVSVALLSLLGGALMVSIGQGQFWDKSWWAFLRLTDPGYLGDDEGTGPRLISTAITIAGYVIFMGALIAIMTQWLHAKIQHLQRGETPISISNHLLILGLTERSPVVIEELLASKKRVRSFLSRRGTQKLSLVVLVEHLDEDLRSDLAGRLGAAWNDREIILRSGTPLMMEHLQRVAFDRAAAILIPGSAQGTEARSYDALTVKTVLTIAKHPSLEAAERKPRIVAEVGDAQLARVLDGAYQGTLEVLPGDAVVSQLIAQTLRHRGLSWLLLELLAQRRGKSFVFGSFPELAGSSFAVASRRLTGGVAIGFVRPGPSGWEPHLNPAEESKLQRDDRLVAIGAAADELALSDDPGAPPEHAARSAPALQQSWPQTRRILILGWNHRVPSLLAELESYDEEGFAVDLVSVMPVDERKAAIESAGVELRRVELNLLVGDYTNVVDLERLDLAAYHNITIVSRGWLETGEVADAQTVLCYAIIQQQLPTEDRPALIVEISDPENSHLFEDRPGEVVYGPEVLGRMVAHTAMCPELHAVTRELFTVGGAEFHFRPASQYGLQGKSMSFREIQEVGRQHGEVVLGLRKSRVALDVRADLRVVPPAAERFELGEDALLLVLATDRVNTPAVA